MMNKKNTPIKDLNLTNDEIRQRIKNILNKKNTKVKKFTNTDDMVVSIDRDGYE